MKMSSLYLKGVQIFKSTHTTFKCTCAVPQNWICHSQSLMLINFKDQGLQIWKMVEDFQEFSSKKTKDFLLYYFFCLSSTSPNGKPDAIFAQLTCGLFSSSSASSCMSSVFSGILTEDWISWSTSAVTIWMERSPVSLRKGNRTVNLLISYRNLSCLALLKGYNP